MSLKSSLLRTGFICAVLMFVATALAYSLKPTQKLAEIGPRIDLEAMIPLDFGTWRLDPNMVPVIPDPTTKYYIDKFYDATIARTYVDRAGATVMLSVAYGGSQNDSLKVHKPEVCYAAGGFEIRSLYPSDVRISLENRTFMIPAKRMIAIHGKRKEPVTYWMTVGNKVATSGFEQKIAQIGYGLRGEIPDGLLFRVSSIGSDSENQFTLHDRFVSDLMSAVTPSARYRLTGLRN